ncbi:hypothetical protein ACFYP4_01670 [Streptomyces sp. NPDC005551]
MAGAWRAIDEVLLICHLASGGRRFQPGGHTEEGDDTINVPSLLRS